MGHRLLVKYITLTLYQFMTWISYKKLEHQLETDKAFWVNLTIQRPAKRLSIVCKTLLVLYFSKTGVLKKHSTTKISKVIGYRL